MTTDRYLLGLVRDVFARRGITEVSISTLPEIVEELADMIEKISEETVEAALGNLTDPDSPARTYVPIDGRPGEPPYVDAWHRIHG